MPRLINASCAAVRHNSRLVHFSVVGRHRRDAPLCALWRFAKSSVTARSRVASLALEIRAPLEAARGLSRIYTEVLVDCLTGQFEAALERMTESGVAIALWGAVGEDDDTAGHQFLRQLLEARPKITIEGTAIARRDGLRSKQFTYSGILV